MEAEVESRNPQIVEFQDKVFLTMAQTELKILNVQYLNNTVFWDKEKEREVADKEVFERVYAWSAPVTYGKALPVTDNFKLYHEHLIVLLDIAHKAVDTLEHSVPAMPEKESIKRRVLFHKIFDELLEDFKTTKLGDGVNRLRLYRELTELFYDNARQGVFKNDSSSILSYLFWLGKAERKFRIKLPPADKHVEDIVRGLIDAFVLANRIIVRAMAEKSGVDTRDIDL